MVTKLHHTKRRTDMSDVKYFYCMVCGNVIEIVHDSGNIPMCCMREMQELEPGTTDGNTDYHVPVYIIRKNKIDVCIGSEPHPMTKDHYIEWVEIVTTKGCHRRFFHPGDEPIAHFRLRDNEELLHIYAYCNIHKLWSCLYKKDTSDSCCEENTQCPCE